MKVIYLHTLYRYHKAVHLYLHTKLRNSFSTFLNQWMHLRAMATGMSCVHAYCIHISVMHICGVARKPVSVYPHGSLSLPRYVLTYAYRLHVCTHASLCRQGSLSLITTTLDIVVPQLATHGMHRILMLWLWVFPHTTLLAWSRQVCRSC